MDSQLSGEGNAIRQVPPSGNGEVPNAGGNGHHRDNGAGPNGQASQRAAISEKQLKFIRSLIGEFKPMGVDFAFAEGLCNRLFGCRLEHLDRAQASTVIGDLSEIKAGRLNVQQALAA